MRVLFNFLPDYYFIERLIDERLLQCYYSIAALTLLLSLNGQRQPVVRMDDSVAKTCFTLL